MKLVFVTWICLVGVPSQAEVRAWKDASGQNEIRAEFVRHTGDQVLLKRDNGIVITVPLASLSLQDQEFISGIRQTNSSMTGEEMDVWIDLPKPMYIGYPRIAGLNHIEVTDDSKRIKSFMALRGTVNVAKGKIVTSSDATPIIGNFRLVTDGNANSADGSFVEIMPGKQWIQIDLEAAHTLQKIAVWHYHKHPTAYNDVIILASDDPEFQSGVTTLWNADHDDSSGMGVGKDPTYYETNYGRVIDGKNTNARYVRLWSNGNTTNDLNHYCEVQVFAVPAK